MLYIADTEDDLPEIAEKMLSECAENRIFAFYGSMGAGKTTFIKQICRKLGTKDNISSPTFALINEYLTDKEEKLYHFDFYRIENIEEALDFGYEEYFYSGNYCFIEWPEKIETLLPANTIKIRIKEIANLKREILW